MGEDAVRLEVLAREGSLDDLRFVVAHLPGGCTPHGKSAERALAAILSRATAADLVHFEGYGREELGHWSAWAGLRPSELHRLPASVQRLATFHRSGYVRETAVAVLSSRDDEDDLPFLFLRMNDWVLPVAIRAATAVTALLTLRTLQPWCAGSEWSRIFEA